MKRKDALMSLALALSLGLMGCGNDVDETVPMASAEEAVSHTTTDLATAPNEGEADTIDTLLHAIREQVGNPQASSREQCRVAGIGHRPCGGPERYLLYSTQTTDEVKLLPMLQRYNALVRQRVQEEGRVGTCEVLPEPGVIVRGGVCVAVEQAER